MNKESSNSTIAISVATILLFLHPYYFRFETCRNFIHFFGNPPYCQAGNILVVPIQQLIFNIDATWLIPENGRITRCYEVGNDVYSIDQKRPVEHYNTLTHGIATLFIIPAVIVLLVLAIQMGDPWRIVSIAIYGISLLLVYLFSTLYHGSHGPHRRTFQQLDHMAIYLLIAGTFTPFTLTVLNGVWGWSLFGIFWTLAVIGIVIDSRYISGPRNVQLAIYLVMGWLMIVAAKPLQAELTTGGLSWLILGGLFYTMGVYFYRRDEKIAYGHAIWHLFVIAGSACHYYAIYNYLL